MLVKKTWIKILALVVGFASFALALYSVRLPELLAVLLESLNAYLVLATAIWVVSILVQTRRWQIMLCSRTPIGFHLTLKLFIMNRLTNLFLPLRAGEGVRVIAARKLTGLDIPYVLATILNERILNIAFLGVLGLLLTFYIDILAPFRLPFFLGNASVIGLIVWVVWKKRYQPGYREDGRTEPQGQGKLRIFWSKFLRGLSVFRYRRVMAGTLVMSLLSWLCVWGAVYLVSDHLDPRQPLICAVAVLFFKHLASLAHLTPSNVGPFQWACIFAFSFFGVNQTEAVGISLVLQAMRIVAALLVGIYVLAYDLARLGLRAEPDRLLDTSAQTPEKA